MKNYITIAALLVAGTAFANAASISDATEIDLSKLTNNTYTFATNAQPGAWSLTMTFDVSQVRSYLEKGQPVASGSATSGLQLVDVTVANDSRIGLDTNFGSAASKIVTSGIYGSWNGGGSENAAVGNYNLMSADLASLNWNNIGTIAVTMSYQYSNSAGNGTNLALVVLDKSGDELASSYGSNTTLRTNSAAKSIYFSDAVTSAYVFNSRLSEADAKTITGAVASAAVPEPSAFGLLAGIGALALVASRRRRK